MSEAAMAIPCEFDGRCRDSATHYAWCAEMGEVPVCMYHQKYTEVMDVEKRFTFRPIVYAESDSMKRRRATT